MIDIIELEGFCSCENQRTERGTGQKGGQPESCTEEGPGQEAGEKPWYLAEVGARRISELDVGPWMPPAAGDAEPCVPVFRGNIKARLPLTESRIGVAHRRGQIRGPGHGSRRVSR